MGFMALLLSHSRKYFGQIGCHAIPGKMNTCMIFQIPIDTRSNAHVVIAPHHHLITLLVKFEEIHR